MNNEKLYNFVEEVLKSNELNRLPDEYGGGIIFAKPLIGVARGDDPIFKEYKEIIKETYLTPLELWKKNGLEMNNIKESDIRAVSIVFPYDDDIREKSKSATKFPAKIYCVARNFANALIFDVLDKLMAYLNEQGFLATASHKGETYNISVERHFPYIYSNWSERHTAYAAGLGTFSLHEGLITEVGCNVRLGSVITNAPLTTTPRKYDDPYANCLFYAKGTCKKCMERCPADAISEEGHDKFKCAKYEQFVAEEMNKRLGNILKPHWRRINGYYKKQVRDPVGCAFCQFNVPCMNTNPMKSMQD
jgi:epoxyqueuosine reductase QueG